MINIYGEKCFYSVNVSHCDITVEESPYLDPDDISGGIGEVNKEYIIPTDVFVDFIESFKKNYNV